MTKADDIMVSIVIPVFNGSNYLREAIESALAQTHRNIEVLVVNDGSTDDGKTERIAVAYGDRIRYVSKPNGGVASALNIGIANMRGAYFSWLSHDDRYAPEKIERQLKALASAPDNAVAYCDFFAMSSSGKVTGKFTIPPRGARSVRCLLAFGLDTLHGCSLLVPKVAFERHGAFDVRLKCTQDYDMWARLATDLAFVRVPEALVYSRQHHEQTSRRQPTLCTLEMDRLHSRLLKDLTDAEVDAYCDGETSFLASAHTTYSNAGHVKTAAVLLRHLCRLCVATQAHDIAINALNAGALLFPDLHNAGAVWHDAVLPLLSRPKVRPRILVYSNVWGRGGLEHVMTIVMNALCRRYEFVLVSTHADGVESFLLEQSITHIALFGSERRPIAHRLTRLCEVLEVDLFIGNPNIQTQFLDVYPLLEELGLPTVACNHYNFFLPFGISGLFSLIATRLETLKTARAATWSNSLSANIYAQSNTNAVLMPNPNTFAVRDAPAALPGKIVLCVGRFHDHVKRIDRALEVFKRVLAAHPDAELVLVGACNLDMRFPPDEGESLREQLQRLGIPASRLQFAGEQPDVGPYYARASVLLATSQSEGFGMTLTEAGCFGVPCVTFVVPGVEDIVLDGENGFSVRQDDLEEMATKVALLLGSHDLRLRMGRRAQDLVRRYSAELICQRWDDLLQTVLTCRDRDWLERLLAERFMTPPSDMAAFSRRAVREYETSIATLMRLAQPQMTEHALVRLARRLSRSLSRDGVVPTAKKVIAKLQAMAASR